MVVAGSRIVPVILAGGEGSRLWPLSRREYPKQFLRLEQPASLLQNTLARLEEGPDWAEPLVVSHQSHRFVLAEQLRALGKSAEILLEQEGRGTAAAVALAAWRVLTRNAGVAQDASEISDPVLVVLPADHSIRDRDAFQRCLRVGLRAAEQGGLVLLGVAPKGPETGFGYIVRADVPVNEEGSVYRVTRFLEKRDRETNLALLAQGGCYWNSGIFLFRASVYLEELGQYCPEIVAASQQAMFLARKERDFIWPDADAFLKCPQQSVDCGLMERTKNALVLELDAGWSDLGSWATVHEIGEKDANGNQLRGRVVAQETRDCLVFAETGLVATLGLQHAMVVQTADAVLVASLDRAQDLRHLVQEIQDSGFAEAREQRKVYKPWGWFEVLAQDEGYLVKRLLVRPGARLSLQYHQHRSEHWVVVQGHALVRLADDERELEEKQWLFIEKGVTHRLENLGTEELVLIEVQFGALLKEEDIVRLEDDYGRV